MAESKTYNGSVPYVEAERPIFSKNEILKYFKICEKPVILPEIEGVVCDKCLPPVNLLRPEDHEKNEWYLPPRHARHHTEGTRATRDSSREITRDRDPRDRSAISNDYSYRRPSGQHETRGGKRGGWSKWKDPDDSNRVIEGVAKKNERSLDKKWRSGRVAALKKEVKRWWYQDPKGKQHGPYNTDQMKEWYERDYFTLDLPLRCHEDAPFVQLRDWFLQGNASFLSKVPPEVLQKLKEQQKEEPMSIVQEAKEEKDSNNENEGRDEVISSSGDLESLSLPILKQQQSQPKGDEETNGEQHQHASTVVIQSVEDQIMAKGSPVPDSVIAMTATLQSTSIQAPAQPVPANFPDPRALSMQQQLNAWKQYSAASRGGPQHIPTEQQQQVPYGAYPPMPYPTQQMTFFQPVGSHSPTVQYPDIYSPPANVAMYQVGNMKQPGTSSSLPSQSAQGTVVPNLPSQIQQLQQIEFQHDQTPTKDSDELRQQKDAHYLYLQQQQIQQAQSLPQQQQSEWGSTWNRNGVKTQVLKQSTDNVQTRYQAPPQVTGTGSSVKQHMQPNTSPHLRPRPNLASLAIDNVQRAQLEQNVQLIQPQQRQSQVQRQEYAPPPVASTDAQPVAVSVPISNLSSPPAGWQTVQKPPIKSFADIQAEEAVMSEPQNQAQSPSGSPSSWPNGSAAVPASGWNVAPWGGRGRVVTQSQYQQPKSNPWHRSGMSVPHQQHPVDNVNNSSTDFRQIQESQATTKSEPISGQKNVIPTTSGSASSWSQLVKDSASIQIQTREDSSTTSSGGNETSFWDIVGVKPTETQVQPEQTQNLQDHNNSGKSYSKTKLQSEAADIASPDEIPSYHQQETASVSIRDHQPRVHQSEGKSTAQNQKRQKKKSYKSKSSKSSPFGASMSSEMQEWCRAQLRSLMGSDDLMPLCDYMMTLTKPDEVTEYVAEYLGRTPQHIEFAAGFLLHKDFENDVAKKEIPITHSQQNQVQESKKSGHGTAAKKRRKKKNNR